MLTETRLLRLLQSCGFRWSTIIPMVPTLEIVCKKIVVASYPEPAIRTIDMRFLLVKRLIAARGQLNRNYDVSVMVPHTPLEKIRSSLQAPSSVFLPPTLFYIRSEKKINKTQKCL